MGAIPATASTTITATVMIMPKSGPAQVIAILRTDQPSQVDARASTRPHKVRLAGEVTGRCGVALTACMGK